MDTKAVGDTSLALVMAALIKAGKTVLMPFGDNKRYDLVVEEGGRFWRVQAKTAHLVEGSLEFNTSSSTYHRTDGGRKDYRGQADLFGVYYPHDDKVYLVPVDVVGKCSARLRLGPAKNKQTKRVRWASEFEFNGSIPL